MDLRDSAKILGTEPEALLAFVNQKQLKGVIELDGKWRVSIFTLAYILDTTPEKLLDLLEDYALGRLIEDNENDELFDAEDGWQVYQSILAEGQK